MPLNAQKAGFNSEAGLFITLVISLLCGLYCLWLLYVVKRNMWAVSQERLESEMVKEVQLSIQRNGTTVEMSISESTIPEKSSKRPVVIDSRIRWIVTLYIIGCILTCIGNVCEHLIYALAENAGRACVRGLYIELPLKYPNVDNIFLGLRPQLPLAAYCLHIIYACSSFTAAEKALQQMYFLYCFPVFNGFGMSRYLFFWYIMSTKLKKKKTTFFLIANEKAISSSQIKTDLKQYLKKLLRLFLLMQIFTFTLYLVGIVPGWDEALWSVVVIDLSVNSSTMLLSFSFAKPAFDIICLCTSPNANEM
ncbi:hypothetical protein RFI_12259 [Reticulomyxa filosa]|uniref:Uncharacterized protein n=1 Tax=Reticulomyxa filosa TaxID=46433 RepID=X6NGS3_RETFI|nr:hypothetical protein RFI_12259 [Reticulomyxa filosa]|eukprot:ETO24899.1 hypothetical protein RFI_12259 [Reticulomyxa filosa]